MDKQLSIFDIRDEETPKKPCEYSFKRYLGQEVVFGRHKDKNGEPLSGKIVRIDKYYTFVKTSKGELVGTPGTISPKEAK